MQALSARTCRLSAAAAALAVSGLRATLTDLNLAGNHLGPAALATLTAAGLPNLLRLNVSDTQIASLDGLERCPSLGVLVAGPGR